MNKWQRAALLVLRDQISDQIDGDSPTDTTYSMWAGLCDIALEQCDDPWMQKFHRDDITDRMKQEAKL